MMSPRPTAAVEAAPVPKPEVAMSHLMRITAAVAVLAALGLAGCMSKPDNSQYQKSEAAKMDSELGREVESERKRQKEADQ